MHTMHKKLQNGVSLVKPVLWRRINGTCSILSTFARCPGMLIEPHDHCRKHTQLKPGELHVRSHEQFVAAMQLLVHTSSALKSGSCHSLYEYTGFHYRNVLETDLSGPISTGMGGYTCSCCFHSHSSVLVTIAVWNNLKEVWYITVGHPTICLGNETSDLQLSRWDLHDTNLWPSLEATIVKM